MEGEGAEEGSPQDRKVLALLEWLQAQEFQKKGGDTETVAPGQWLQRGLEARGYEALRLPGSLKSHSHGQWRGVIRGQRPAGQRAVDDDREESADPV